MAYLGFTTEEWAAARSKVADDSIERDDFSIEQASRWMLLRAAECRADGATVEEAVKQAVGEVFQP